eukprot:g1464.t1
MRETKSRFQTHRTTEDATTAVLKPDNWEDPIGFDFDDGGQGFLHLQEGVLASWFQSNGDNTLPRIKSRADLDAQAQTEEKVYIRYPIFMPSRGRAFPTQASNGARREGARLDLSRTMGIATYLPGCESACEYLQIVCVVSEEIDEYKRAWPNLNFFELPPAATALGIGASRFYMKHLAYTISSEDFPFSMMMDDSIRGFTGFTLKNDPQDLFGKGILPDKAQMQDIPLRFALQHFMSDDFQDRDRFVL